MNSKLELMILALLNNSSLEICLYASMCERQTLNKTIKLVEIFRESNKSTPIVLMGYNAQI